MRLVNSTTKKTKAMTYRFDLRSFNEGGQSLQIFKNRSQLNSQLWNAMPLRAELLKWRARVGLAGSSIILTCLLHTFWLEKV